MFYRVFLILFLFHNISFAEISINECGTYQMQGKIIKNEAKDGYVYIVNEGSKSQYKFTIPLKLEFKISPYIKFPSKLVAQFSKKIEGYRGEISEIKSISLAVPDPIYTAQEKTLILISKEECIP